MVQLTRLLATWRASTIFLKKAARPTLTSRTSALIFSAAFFETIEAVAKFTLSTVAVISRAAYIIRSAGTRLFVCPAIQHPALAKHATICSLLRFTLKPDTEKNLKRYSSNEGRNEWTYQGWTRVCPKYRRWNSIPGPKSSVLSDRMQLGLEQGPITRKIKVT